MSKTVRKEYPAARLPDDLRPNDDPNSRVTVTIEEEVRPVEAAASGFRRLKRLRRSHFVSGSEVNAHVSALRDEWKRR